MKKILFFKKYFTTPSVWYTISIYQQGGFIVIDKLKYCSLAELNYLARKSKFRKLAILELRNRVLGKGLSWIDERGIKG